MRTRNLFRPWWGGSLVLLLSACGSTDNPYSRFENPPLVEAQLHAVTLVSDSDAVAADVLRAGWTEVTLPPNYQRADAVEAAIWSVPEPVATQAKLFKAPPGKPDIRLLVMPLATRGREAAPSVDQAFFRNVLGTDVPGWPLERPATDNARVQAWSYRVPSIVAASKRLRDNGIPVIYDPVSITTSYLGTYKTLAIRSPDGTVVQLVEATAQ